MLAVQVLLIKENSCRTKDIDQWRRRRCGYLCDPIAKQYGVEVTGVDRTDKLDMLLSMVLIMSLIIQREDFTKMENVMT
jgi:hypothetical protein